MGDKLDEIFDDDDLGLLDVEEKEKKKSSGDNIIARRFLEINAFYKDNGREPSEDGSFLEKRLYSRLQSIKEDDTLIELLKEYDEYGLLKKKEKESSGGIEDIFEDDDLGLLSSDDEDIFDLRHVKATERIDPDYIAQRSRCVDFDAKYREGIESVINDLNQRKRDLVEFRSDDLEVGRYYVLKGMILYLAEDASSDVDFDFNSGKKTRRDGRTRCVFANGTESPLLYRSLVKALQKDGLAISDVHDAELPVDTIDSDDVQNGYIYVLTSQSQKPEIRDMKNLYKIGFCSGDVHDRIKNAANEPTYLMSGVNIILTARCYNMNARILEDNMHKFCGKSNANFIVKDKQGKEHHPREWFIVPLDVIERAIQLIKEDRIGDYRYDPELNAIIELSKNNG